MAVNAFSDEWARQFKDEVNKSSAYKAAARAFGMNSPCGAKP